MLRRRSMGIRCMREYFCKHFRGEVAFSFCTECKDKNLGASLPHLKAEEARVSPSHIGVPKFKTIRVTGFTILQDNKSEVSLFSALFVMDVAAMLILLMLHVFSFQCIAILLQQQAIVPFICKTLIVINYFFLCPIKGKLFKK